MTGWKKLPSPPARRRISGRSAQWSSPLSSNFASRDVIPVRPYVLLSERAYALSNGAGEGKKSGQSSKRRRPGMTRRRRQPRYPACPARRRRRDVGGGAGRRKRRRLRMSLRPSGV
ncbi:hypothetical protein J1605_021530 [Eschrichtius robustus]|uniref:Uncharacterized protein n=1 Tax=Eschrichtius robustus TaxID=9764 RepID=A0AB34HFF9_ESCRO|nr:hypothetical protein J1605_021530 [Eschrichtius robustus]